VVARHNAQHFSIVSGTFPLDDLPPRMESPTLAWIAGSSDDALTQYLDEHFASFFENPYTRSLVFRNEDQVDSNLVHALFRAECVGYWQGIHRRRQSIGHYRLLSEAGRTGPGVATGFAFLRRAGDAQGVARAAAVYRASGPLEVPRSAGIAACRASWLDNEIGADLELITMAAVTFPQEVAGPVLDRILGGLSELVSRRFGTALIYQAALNATTSLARSADVDHVVAASVRLREIADRPADPLLHQSLGRSLSLLPWDRLSKIERMLWLTFVKTHLSARDDLVFPARSAAQGLIAAGSSIAINLVSEAYLESRSLLIAPLVLGATRLRSGILDAAIDDILMAAKTLQVRAQQGQFSFGVLSIGGLLGAATMRSRTRRAWDAYGSFVLDKHVPFDEREGAISNLMRAPETAPRWLQKKLRQGLPTTEMAIPLGGSPARLEVTNVGLQAVFGGIEPTDALSSLIDLAGSADSDVRTEVVKVASSLGSVLESASLATLLIGLTHDPLPQIRGLAGRGLALVPFGQVPLEKVRISRLLRMCEESGETVPAYTWSGLARSRELDLPADPRLLNLAKTVATDHIASTIRDAAAAFLKADAVARKGVRVGRRSARATTLLRP
jgi:hypothetical protein